MIVPMLENDEHAAAVLVGRELSTLDSASRVGFDEFVDIFNSLIDAEKPAAAQTDAAVDVSSPRAAATKMLIDAGVREAPVAAPVEEEEEEEEEELPMPAADDGK